MEAINNGVPFINGKLYDWADIVTTIAGVPVTGIVAIEYSDDQEVEVKYGAGRYPVGYGKGRIKPTAKITLYQEEVEAIQAQSVNGRLQDIAPFNINVTYMPDSGIVKTDKLRNCMFKNNKRNWKEGDTGKTVELDLLLSNIDWAK
ncbi:hypothetical protein HMPREF3034_00789 [Prevotella sp. DNF00663]|uniref:hypothetical protein n=1 Tax=Prevotella sp. DNF00663 TaxID=1384078 RepID=UPI000782E951|nr:hypothetical protein [Prevotella sp. DNF00663]KXB84534.1 hypothetical protein HMPREF3034_00789 [Prevotella sp. DNF00663]